MRLDRGTLDAAAEAALMGHLGRCGDCSAAFGAIVASSGPAGAAPPPVVDAGVRAILDRIAVREPPPDHSSRPLPTVPGLDDLEEVGRGGMAVVYRARETRLDRVVAVKVLRRGGPAPRDSLARAEREARLLTRIAHPNVVRIHYVADADGTPAIVMEWIDGPSLEAHAASGPLPLREAVSVVADVARGVAAIHACGLVHRDIKPANILLAPAAAGARPTPKLIDFGLARPEAETAAGVTHESVAIGTPSFMAPEQTGLDPTLGPVGPAADVHGLGGLLYWLLSGRAPHDGLNSAETLVRAACDMPRPLGTIVAGLPGDILTIVETCLARRPERRYASAAALVDDLERFLDHRPIHARPAGPAEKLIKWCRRRPALAALSVCAATSVLVLAGFVAYHVQSLRAANATATAGRDAALQAETLARRSFERLTDSTAERFLARGTVLGDADRDHLVGIRDEYRAWPLGPDPAAGLRFRADGLMRVARIFDRLHRVPETIDAAAASLQCLDDLERLGPVLEDDEARREEASRALLACLARSGRVGEAEAAARGAVVRLEGRDGEDPGASRRLALAWADLANVETMAGNVAESLALHRRAVDRFEELIAADPDDGRLRRSSLAVLYNAAICLPIDDPARHDMLERLVARAEEGLAAFPDDRDEWGRGLLLGLAALGYDLIVEGRPAEALAVIERRAASARTLAGEMPDSDHFRGEIVGAATQAVACHTALGAPEAAEADLQAALDIASAAVADAPAVASRTRVLVEALFARAAWFTATGRRGEAIADYRRVVEVLSPWVREGGGALAAPAGFPESLGRARAEIGKFAGDGEPAR